MPLPSEILKNKFPHEPTACQLQMFNRFDEFIQSKDSRPAFLLKGYAGTGKTSILGTLVKTLPLFNYKFVLLAPTGRAAKVISQYSQRTAFTIHKKIYKTKSDKEQKELLFSKLKNYQKNTLFIVDEASMISSDSDFQSGNLLHDLVDYVFEQENNKLVLVGDTAQLPPVNQSKSLALDHEYLRDSFKLSVYECTLREITRQAIDSGVLVNATKLREVLNQKNPKLPKIQTAHHSDIFRMTSEKLEDGIRYAHDKFGIENTIVICRSNKNAVMYNHYIRNNLLFREEELEVGDMLMISRNNYTFTNEEIPSGFLANGDFIEVIKIKKDEEMHHLRFADLEVRLIDYPNSSPIEVKVILDGLHSYSPALTKDQNQELFRSVLADYTDLPKKEQREAIKKDKYLNALQVKYSYALTCHKSQGGQWDAVFVDQGYLGEDFALIDFIRWSYTAMTRAKNELFLVNFDSKFF